jgi:hypothetical protein
VILQVVPEQRIGFDGRKMGAATAEGHRPAALTDAVPAVRIPRGPRPARARRR